MGGRVSGRQIFVAKDVETKLTRPRSIKGLVALGNPHKGEEVAGF